MEAGELASQTDLKTFSALGCYGMTVLTALPVQNTMGVRSIYDITPLCVKDQLESILEDISIDALKIGMLHREEIIDVVAQILHRYKPSNAVLDPVMLAKSGDQFLLPSAMRGSEGASFRSRRS